MNKCSLVVHKAAWEDAELLQEYWWEFLNVFYFTVKTPFLVTACQHYISVIREYINNEENLTREWPKLLDCVDRLSHFPYGSESVTLDNIKSRFI